jgi:hypothetical protein
MMSSDRIYGKILTWWFGYSTCSVVWRLDAQNYTDMKYAVAIWFLSVLMWLLYEKETK